jgi:pimeloyl-ACP methyl ester carboxylesterase
MRGPSGVFFKLRVAVKLDRKRCGPGLARASHRHWNKWKSKLWGLHNGVVCSEWVLYESAGNVLKEGRHAFPSFPTSVLVQGPQFPFMTELCCVWQVPKAPAWQREITRSAIPTLVIAGSFDAITSVAEAAARPLAKGPLWSSPAWGTL